MKPKTKERRNEATRPTDENLTKAAGAMYAALLDVAANLDRDDSQGLRHTVNRALAKAEGTIK